jgi:hypothetical protein
VAAACGRSGESGERARVVSHRGDSEGELFRQWGEVDRGGGDTLKPLEQCRPERFYKLFKVLY